MNAHDGGVRTAYFPEPMSVAERFHADMADLPLLVAESRMRLDRQRAEARARVDRLLEQALGSSEASHEA